MLATESFFKLGDKPALSSDPLKNLDEPARGSPLPHFWYDGQTLSQNNPTDLLDRGCVSRRRNLTL